MLTWSFIWEKMKTMYFLETIEDYVTKVCRSSELNEYVEFYEYQRSRLSIDLGLRSLRFNISNVFFSETDLPI